MKIELTNDMVQVLEELADMIDKQVNNDLEKLEEGKEWK